jgi:hypothetical protein
MIMRKQNLVAAVLLLLMPAALRAQPPAFFAPAEPTGRLAVRLYPMENVTAGAPRLVTFGVPFPRGSLTPAQINTVRVFKGAAEIPAFVEALTPWRHFTDPSIDGASVRVARIQIQYTFTSLHPQFETIEVEWGVGARTQSVATLQNPRTGWHQVTGGSFVAADGVSEPDVYAV